MIDPYDELHDVKNLAALLKRHENYVYAMRQCGFEMPANRASLRMAMDWLKAHPDFRRADAWPVRTRRIITIKRI